VVTLFSVVSDPVSDAYAQLGVTPSATDAQVRAAYRRLVQIHHPDHNGGSPDAARRFEAINEAYARVMELRKQAAAKPKQAAAKPPPRAQTQPPPRTRSQPPPTAPPPPADPAVEARIAELERQLREAEAARERARRAAREAATTAARERPTDEELGYVTTDDTFSKIFSDAKAELSGRLSGVRGSPLGKRLADLIDELDGRHRS
jgi:curved DNA-binding protein CbpA